jgi:hypothetical protein
LGGRYGGWDVRDHDAFLKVITVIQASGDHANLFFNNQKGTNHNSEYVINTSQLIDPQFVAKFVNFIPLKSADEIEQHIRW